MWDFILLNYVEMLSGVLAFLWMIVRLTPSSKDNIIFEIVDKVINSVFLSKRAKKKIQVQFLKDFENKTSVKSKVNERLIKEFTNLKL